MYYPSMTRMFYEDTPGLLDRWRDENPQQRIGRPEELRGLVVWLASDASTYVNGSEYVASPPLLFVSSDVSLSASSSTADTRLGKLINIRNMCICIRTSFVTSSCTVNDHMYYRKHPDSKFMSPGRSIWDKLRHN